MILISDFPDMVVDQVEVAETITIRLHATSPAAACPWCGVQAQRVQSRYIRHLADLPASGRRVRFVLQVRRYFCQKRTCGRKIFAERFPSLALPYAQRTIRLQEALRSLGLIAGGEPGAKLGAHLGYAGSADTILLLLHQVSIASGPSPRIVGDDWAWKKGQRYGTIIIDQERHRVVDLLADHSVETVAAWFRAHPSVEIVSRDRSAEYARAIRQGAPHAIQVADRFHLLQNLREAVQELLGQCWKELRERAKPPEDLRAEAVAPLEVGEWRPHPQPRRETIRVARQAERAERYEQVVALHAQGLSTQGDHSRAGANRTLAEKSVHSQLFLHCDPPFAKQTVCPRSGMVSFMDKFSHFMCE